jgi:hypothetical protein
VAIQSASTPNRVAKASKPSASTTRNRKYGPGESKSLPCDLRLDRARTSHKAVKCETRHQTTVFRDADRRRLRRKLRAAVASNRSVKLRKRLRFSSEFPSEPRRILDGRPFRLTTTWPQPFFNQPTKNSRSRLRPFEIPPRSSAASAVRSVFCGALSGLGRFGRGA